MTTDRTDPRTEPGDGAGALEHRLRAAEELCAILRHRVDALERERETVRARLEGILTMLDGMATP
jgi:hypothetical protein